MRFKRETITRETLDKLSRTMSVIPTTEMMIMLGEGEPIHFDDYINMLSWLSSHVQSSNYVEATFYIFADGTYAVNVDYDHSTTISCDIWLQQKSDGWYYDGKKVVGAGHTHRSSSNPSEDDIPGKYPGVTDYIIYNGRYHTY